MILLNLSDSPRSVLDDMNSFQSLDCRRLKEAKPHRSFYLLEKIEETARKIFPKIAAQAAQGGEKFLEKLALKKQHKKEHEKKLKKAKKQRKAKRVAEEKRLNKIADTERGKPQEKFSKRNFYGSAVQAAFSGIKQVKLPYDIRLASFYKKIDEFIEQKIEKLIDDLEHSGLDEPNLFLDYTEALKNSEKIFLNDLRIFIDDSIIKFFNQKEEKNVNARDIVQLHQGQFKIVFTHAIIEDRAAFIMGSQLHAADAIEEYIQGKGFLPKHLLKLEEKYRALCEEYMGNEEREPKFGNFYYMEEAFRDYVDRLVSVMSKAAQPINHEHDPLHNIVASLD